MADMPASIYIHILALSPVAMMFPDLSEVSWLSSVITSMFFFAVVNSYTPLLLTPVAALVTTAYHL